MWHVIRDIEVYRLLCGMHGSDAGTPAVLSNCFDSDCCVEVAQAGALFGYTTGTSYTFKAKPGRLALTCTRYPHCHSMFPAQDTTLREAQALLEHPYLRNTTLLEDGLAVAATA